MLFISMLRWWYGVGWQRQVNALQERLLRSADFFSFEQNIRELFLPFKQIDADKPKSNSINLMMRAAFDNLFSRIFGAIIRSSLIVSGIVAMILEAALGVLRLVAWPLIPVMPLGFFMLALMGYEPWL